MKNIYLAIKVRVINHLCRICNKLNITFYYRSRYGIKVINHTSTRNVKKDAVQKAIKLDPKSLYLPFDCIKGNYTLLDTSVPESPHFKLMKGCAEIKNV